MHKSFVLESMEIAQSMTKHLLTKAHTRTQIQLVLHMVNDAIKAHLEMANVQPKKGPSCFCTVIPNGARKMEGGDGHGGRK